MIPSCHAARAYHDGRKQSCSVHPAWAIGDMSGDQWYIACSRHLVFLLRAAYRDRAMPAALAPLSVVPIDAVVPREDMS